MDYPAELARKRITTACNHCRKRKRRCDGKQPMCTLCRESNKAECQYQEPEYARQNAAFVERTSDILERLERLESSINRGSNSTDNHQPAYNRSPSQGSQTHEQDSANKESHSLPSSTSSETQQQCPPFLASLGVATAGQFPQQAANYSRAAALTGEDNNAPPMTIPMPHSTTTGSLLQLAPLKALLGDYPQDLFFRIESKREVPKVISFEQYPLNQITFPPLDRLRTDHLVDSFFSLVNTQHPLLDRAHFNLVYNDILEQGPHPSVECALVFVVFALGSVASEKPDTQELDWLPGVQYFTPALRVLLALWPSFFGANPALPQALYLGALYFSYLARPLQSWRLVHMASTSLQLLWIQCETSNSIQKASSHENCEVVIRTCWAIFVLECDIIAEHHLPRSGIEQVVEKLSFPRCTNLPTPDILRWLADLSARRMQNRIHHVMYNTVPTATCSESYERGTFMSLATISAELNSQLQNWFDLLPLSIKPNLNNREPKADEVNTILRYHAIGEMIFRPFLCHVCTLPQGEHPPDFVTENALMCLHHCREYLRVVCHRSEAPSGSTEAMLHSTLAVTLVLTLASLCPLLSHAVNEIDILQEKAISLFKTRAFPGSGIEGMLKIVVAMRDKRRMLI